MSFDEAAELAYFGAKILHPATITALQRQRDRRAAEKYDGPESPGHVRYFRPRDDDSKSFHAVAPPKTESP